MDTSSTLEVEGMSNDTHPSTSSTTSNSKPDAEAVGSIQAGEMAHGGSSGGGGGSLSLRIASVFIVLVAGLVGCAVPLVLQVGRREAEGV